VDAALALAAERRWRDVTLADIAAHAGLDLARLHEAYRSKAAILAAFVDRADAAMLAGTPPDAAEEPVRDRLLDALLRRIEILSPHKHAISSIARDIGTPGLALCMGARLMRSMAWALESAGANPHGLSGRLRVKALAAIYLSGIWIWLRDEDPELARTMAHLDKRLTQAERLAGICERLVPSRS
jgi:AcrR family transcriptional regulator